MFEYVGVKTACCLEIVKEAEWEIKASTAAPSPAFNYFILTVSRVDTMADAVKDQSFLNVLAFLTMNTKTVDQAKVPENTVSVTMFDSAVAAFTAVRMLTKGLDASSVNVLSFKFNLPNLLQNVSIIPSTSCFTGYSVLMAQDSVKLAEILNRAEEVTGLTGVLTVSNGEKGYEDMRQLRMKTVETRCHDCMRLTALE